MDHFRQEKNVERIEDVVFNLETAINTVIANTQHQRKDNYRFVCDNTGEIQPFDWYNSKIIVNFKVELLADGANLAAGDHNGIVNGSHSLIAGIIVKVNGIQLYDNNMANQSVNIKNLLEYNPSYANSSATNQLFYLDTSGSAEERPAEALYNRGFAMRKASIRFISYC